MFGISGGELFFIIIVAIIVLGPDKIPGAMRTFGKFMANVKNATNDIKSEIQKSVDVQELQQGINKISNPISEEINKIKNSVAVPNIDDITKDINEPLQKETNDLKQEIDELTGPIKRQR